MKHNWNVEQVDDRQEGIVGVVLTARSKTGGFMMQDVFTPREARDLAQVLVQTADSLAPIEEPETTVEDLEERADVAVPPFPESSGTPQTEPVVAADDPEAPENGKVEEAVFSEA